MLHADIDLEACFYKNLGAIRSTDSFNYEEAVAGLKQWQCCDTEKISWNHYENICKALALVHAVDYVRENKIALDYFKKLKGKHPLICTLFVMAETASPMAVCPLSYVLLLVELCKIKQEEQTELFCDLF